MTTETWVPMNDLSRAIGRERKVLTTAFEAVLDSGYLIHGPQHLQFEAKLAHAIGVSHAVGVASGTDALELAIKTTMPPGKSRVLTAANAGGYTTVASRRAGFVPVYADVDDTSLCVTADTVRENMTADVGVVVVTHLFGNLTDMAPLVAYCEAAGVALVEDCAQSIGSTRGGVKAGASGDAAAVSFYPTKNLGALGDGGAVATNNSETAAHLRLLRQYGWASKYSIAETGGINSRLDEMQAAFLSTRLDSLDEANARRRAIITRYAEAAIGTSLKVMPADGEHHVGHLAVARTPHRGRVVDHLADRHIRSDIHFPTPDHRQPAFEVEYRGVSLPVTEAAASEIVSLPCFPELTEAEVLRVTDAIHELAAVGL